MSIIIGGLVVVVIFAGIIWWASKLSDRPYDGKDRD